MKRRAFNVVFPVALAVSVAFCSTVFLTTADPSFAATGKKKAAAVAEISAVEHTEARIKLLQGALNITEEQKPLWNNLTLVMRDNAKNMDSLSKDRAENGKKLGTVEQMKFQSYIAENRSEQLKRFIPAFEALYASLSDDQKTVIDALFQTGKHGKHRMK
jgi:hypothetical protein